MGTLILKVLYFTLFKVHFSLELLFGCHQNCFGFCSNWKYVCVIKTNVIVGKEPSIADVFHSSNIWFHLLGVW